jgi:2-polyprenyl-3-methyl-5-hydroxy-6-metoxy-1,4-benzoquinol methylase
MRWFNRIGRRNIQDRFDFTIEALQPIDGKRFLDVGCGTGRYGVELARRGARQVTGIDFSGEMLNIARRLAREGDVADRCAFLQVDVLQYQPEEPFDSVIANGFFDYVRRPRAVFEHLRTMTRVSLIATFPAQWAFRTVFRKAWLSARGCPVFFYGENDILQLCKVAKYSCRQILRRGPIYLLEAAPTNA